MIASCKVVISFIFLPRNSHALPGTTTHERMGRRGIPLFFHNPPFELQPVFVIGNGSGWNAGYSHGFIFIQASFNR
jgi:hypothetical protein